MDQISSQSTPFDFLQDDFFMDEILSRVDSAKSIVRLGMTSKRFHSLCSYPSVLKFKDVSHKNVGLIKYLDKFFESRMDSNFKYEFQQLLMGLSENMDPPTILNFFHGEPFASDFHNERPELNLQNSMIPLKHLRVLILRNIPISINQSFGDWISNYCVSLEELGLYDVLVLPTKLTITSSSLRFFFIEGDLEELHVANAPKLEALNFTGRNDTIRESILRITNTSQYYYDLETPLEWLQNALSLDVWELDLQFGDDDNNIIINIKYCDYFKVPELKFQYSNPLNNLRILTLKDIPIGLNHSFEDWVLTSCVDLQVLELRGVFVLPGKLTIASSSLRAFTIDAHFMDLHVSAPKLMALQVKWNLASCDETHKTKYLSLRVSNSPDLKELWVSNLLTSLPLEYYNSSDDKSSFPSLESSTVLIPEIHNNISLDSLMRLLVDSSQARKLFVSNSIIHKVFF
ncbi:hypothetical protein K1719_014780 [Acacia pycnantha]|nr:hypothetical protein K1719_014780 [Acacia pycnantha]